MEQNMSGVNLWNTSLWQDICQSLDRKRDRIVEIRRRIHAYPEQSFQEEKTAAYLESFYRDVKPDELLSNFGGQRGLVAYIRGKQAPADGTTAPVIALRADFDALPITEETGLPFASRHPGTMHACGHDGHTAYLMVLAETLNEFKDRFAGTIKIIHQPAEEMPPGGALAMIKAGCLKDVDRIFGIHVSTEFETGKIMVHSGNTQSGRAHFKLKIQGRGGHGSSPHLCNDAIVAGANFVTTVQTVVSRRINPFDTAVVTIGSFDGKGQFNVIADSVVLEGDVRSMSDSVSKTVEQEIRRLVSGLEHGFGVQTELSYTNDYPVLYNDPEAADLVRSANRRALESGFFPELKEIIDGGPQPPSEDFAYYLKEIPGCFFYVGARPTGDHWYPHHHPKFDINEDSLLICAKAMAAVVLEALQEKPAV